MIQNLSTTTFRMAYLVEVNAPFERMAIQYMPDEIMMQRQPMVVGIQPIGRNHPFYHFTGGEDHMQFTLRFFADDLRRRSAIEKVRWLESLTYIEPGQMPAQPVKLVFGKLFNRQTWVVRNVDTRLYDFDLLRSYRPLRAECTVNLSLFTDQNVARSEVRGWF